MIKRIAPIALLAFILSGCTAPDPAAAKLEDGRLIVVFCDAKSADQIRVTSSKTGDQHRVVDWIADGAFPAGQEPTEIHYGEPPDGMTTETGPNDLPVAGRSIYITLSVLGDSGEAVSDQFATFNGDDLSEDHWVRSSGGSFDSACA